MNTTLHTDPLAQAAADYRRIGGALDFLGERWRERPSYAEAAARAGLSPHHFHRLFTRWVGVSPKRYVDALAHAEARKVLQDGASVLDAAYDVGLSGPSRLHDLFIAHEAATPGDAKRRGEGLCFTWGVAPTPFGEGAFLMSPRGLSGLGFADPGEEEIAAADLCARFPAAGFRRDDEEARAWSRKVFVGGGPIPLALFGTPWRLQVWRALLSIPAGETTTYRTIAEDVGDVRACRAVGAAVGANPVSWLIPCHRVLASDGRLTGYHWGLERKRAMLVYEAARRDKESAAA